MNYFKELFGYFYNFAADKMADNPKTTFFVAFALVILLLVYLFGTAPPTFPQ